MSTSPSKNNILKKIRMALAQPTPLPFPQSEGSDPLVQPPQQDPVVEFAEVFTSLQGRFLFCETEAEAQEGLAKLCYQHQWTRLYCAEERWRRLLPPASLMDDIATCEAAATGCELLIARTGSIVLSSTYNGRIPSVYAPVHLCFATTSQLVYDIKDGLQALQQKYRQYLPSLITLATGPSRTADIEKTLVVGVHGPKEVYLFLIDDQA